MKHDMTRDETRLLLRAATHDFGEAHVSNYNRRAAIRLHTKDFGMFVDTGSSPMFRLHPDVRKRVQQKMRLTKISLVCVNAAKSLNQIIDELNALKLTSIALSVCLTQRNLTDYAAKIDKIANPTEKN